jgi:hypothetical protein
MLHCSWKPVPSGAGFLISGYADWADSSHKWLRSRNSMGWFAVHDRGTVIES